MPPYLTRHQVVPRNINTHSPVRWSTLLVPIKVLEKEKMATNSRNIIDFMKFYLKKSSPMSHNVVWQCSQELLLRGESFLIHVYEEVLVPVNDRQFVQIYIWISQMRTSKNLIAKGSKKWKKVRMMYLVYIAHLWSVFTNEASHEVTNDTSLIIHSIEDGESRVWTKKIHLVEI